MDLYVVHFNDGSSVNYLADSYSWNKDYDETFKLTTVDLDTGKVLTIMICPTSAIHHVDHMQTE